jgi:NAD(P)-dependent dehydrogenase (short-subunit alcohol dehydrogenase family)
MVSSASIDGRVCLITGATNGIGKETALALARMGATIIMVARNAEKGEAALADVRQRSANDRVTLLVADLASLSSVRRLAQDFRDQHQELHVLINNAGAFNSQRALSDDGYELTFAVNHLAHFLLTTLLLDLLKASAPSRIINVSSGAHTRAEINFDDLSAEAKYGGMSAYGQSKLANVLFTYELARQLAGTGVTANALHPGVVKTGFGRNNGGATGLVVKAFHAVAGPFLLSAGQGAETSIYLASSSEVDSVSGKYFVKKEPVRSSEASEDVAVAQKLWQVSEELVG